MNGLRLCLFGAFMLVEISSVLSNLGGTVTAELNVFSGRRNPRKIIPLRLVHELIPYFGTYCLNSPLESVLGYRGFTLYSGHIRTVIPRGSNRRAELGLLRIFNVSGDLKNYIKMEILRRRRPNMHRHMRWTRCNRIPMMHYFPESMNNDNSQNDINSDI